MDHDLERILDDHYLDGLADRPVTELRSLRAECQSVEGQLSYLRRLVQGRHDIVIGESERRRSGGDPGDLPGLVERLPDILASHSRAPGPGRRPSGVETPEPSGRLVARLGLIADAVPLDTPGALGDADLSRTARDLELLEEEVSSLRQAVFDRIDAIEGELTRRYAEGEARVDDLLTRHPD